MTETATEIFRDVSDLALPGWTDVVASGEWFRRYEGDWRESVNLATADRATVYAAGADDGYRLAWAEVYELHRSLASWLEIMRIEALECCSACGRKLRHPKSSADELYPACDKGWSL